MLRERKREMKPSTVIVLVLVVAVAQYASLSTAAGPKVIIVGAGMSGKSLASYTTCICMHGSLHSRKRMLLVLNVRCFAGISAGKRLSEAGITDLVILEATERIGGRIHKTKFAGVNVEMGANWVEGVNGDEMNPIWTMANGTGGLNLRTFRSDFDHLASNIYKQEYI
jgi:polyamine oxidase